MRSAILLTLLPLAACGGGGKQKQAEADARAAGFVPPSVLSRLDYGGQIERRFHSLDRDGDDAIAADELPRQESRLQQLDVNHDGRITSDEWSRGMLARFDRQDANHDGSLTSDERQLYQAANPGR